VVFVKLRRGSDPAAPRLVAESLLVEAVEQEQAGLGRA